MSKASQSNTAFCKTFPDSSHVTVLWTPAAGARIEIPDDIWSLPHDMAGEFLRRVAEGRPTEADRQILEDCSAAAAMAFSRVPPEQQ